MMKRLFNNILLFLLMFNDAQCFLVTPSPLLARTNGYVSPVSSSARWESSSNARWVMGSRKGSKKKKEYSKQSAFGSGAGFAGGLSVSSQEQTTSRLATRLKGVTAPEQQRVTSRTSSSTTAAARPSAAAQAVEQRIQAALAELASTNAPLHEALQLRQRIAKWDAATAGLSILDQAALPARQVAQMDTYRLQLERVKAAHGITELILTAAFQKATWDAVAAGRAARHHSLGDDMPASAEAALREVVTSAIYGGKKQKQSAQEATAACDMRIVDVGCGSGILIKYLKEAGVAEENVLGLDLSPNMVAAASQYYPTAMFEVADFLAWATEQARSGNVTWDAVIMNAVLHHFHDVELVLQRASGILKPGGRIVIGHPKGSLSVSKQHNANRLLAPSLMPSMKRLEEMCACNPDLALQVVTEESVAGLGKYLVNLEKTA